MAIGRFAKLSHVLLRPFLLSTYVFFVVPFALSQSAAPVALVSATNSPSMTFDVASIRESHPDPNKGFMIGGAFSGRTSLLRLSNVKIVDMIRMAYGLSSHNILELPDWTGGAMFNVEAKSDDATDRKLATLTEEQVVLEQQHMLQGLLAERFNLKAHWSAEGRPIYKLVFAKRGPKVRTGGSLPLSDDDLKRFGGNKTPEIFQRGDGKLGYEYIGRNCHIASLARVLGGLMSTDVSDKTGLSSTYDFDLRYSQASDADREKDPRMFPPISEALEDQLGLKLERANGTVRKLAVDHIDKQSAN
jgi:uncharacterized protein (TIGR03435 family)